MPEALITGIGITSAVGQGKARFMRALLNGEHAFGIMERLGRRKEGIAFIGAEIPKTGSVERQDERLWKTASFCGMIALTTLKEAWSDARLDEILPEKIGLIIGGSNLQQRDHVNAVEAYSSRPLFVKPSYSLSLWDTDLCGLCTEAFPIRGMACSLGGGSASGQLAVMQAVESIQSGKLDVCVALGALTDISYLECQALRNIGAMGTTRYARDPSLACRPFDRTRDGFIYGESCGAVVVESLVSASARKARAYGAVVGQATVLAGTRNPSPDRNCEAAVIRKAIAVSGLSPGDIDYINPHGSGTVLGDTIELQAIAACGLSHAFINATKSITGHGLSSSGAVEIITTLLQMEAGQLHPSRNLTEPDLPLMNWVVGGPVNHRITNALCLSHGFGGINTAMCLQNRIPEGERE